MGSSRCVIGAEGGRGIQFAIDGLRRLVYILNRNGVGYSFRRIKAVGKGEIKVSKIPLTQGRLGDLKINFGYGEGKVGGRDALLVVTERDEGGGQMTIRFRPAETEDVGSLDQE